MELRRYVAVLRRRLIIVLLTVAAGLTAGYISTDQTPRYTATATLYVGQRQLVAAYGSVSNDVLSAVERFSLTYAAMIDSLPTATDAVQRAKLPRSPQAVVGQTEAAPVKGTSLLSVKVVDRNPAAAQLIANSLADSFVEKIETFEPTAEPKPGEVPALPAYVFERASLPAVPQPTGVLRHLILGAAFGFAVAAALAFTLEYIDITLKSATDAERKLELPVLGVIPFDAAATDLPSWTARAS